jgi:hypothetical protein
LGIDARDRDVRLTVNFGKTIVLYIVCHVHSPFEPPG